MSSSSWYLIMIGSIFMAVLAFVFGTTLFGYESEQQSREVGIFIGLWAPTLMGIANYFRK